MEESEHDSERVWLCWFFLDPSSHREHQQTVLSSSPGVHKRVIRADPRQLCHWPSVGLYLKPPPPHNTAPRRVSNESADWRGVTNSNTPILTGTALWQMEKRVIRWPPYSYTTVPCPQSLFAPVQNHRHAHTGRWVVVVRGPGNKHACLSNLDTEHRLSRNRPGYGAARVTGSLGTSWLGWFCMSGTRSGPEIFICVPSITMRKCPS